MRNTKSGVRRSSSRRASRSARINSFGLFGDGRALEHHVVDLLPQGGTPPLNTAHLRVEVAFQKGVQRDNREEVAPAQPSRQCLDNLKVLERLGKLDHIEQVSASEPPAELRSQLCRHADTICSPYSARSPPKMSSRMRRPICQYSPTMAEFTVRATCCRACSIRPRMSLSRRSGETATGQPISARLDCGVVRGLFVSGHRIIVHGCGHTYRSGNCPTTHAARQAVRRPEMSHRPGTPLHAPCGR